MKPAFIYFDAAHTLIEPWPGVAETYAMHAERHGVKARAALLEGAFGPAWKAVRLERGDSPYGTTEETARGFWRRVVEETFERAGSSMPADPYFDELYEAFATPACWRAYADALPAIDRVRRAGIGVGLLSNFDGRLRRLLRAMEWDSHFDAVIVSCEVGAEKPSPRIFEAARAAAGGHDAARMAFVGDSPAEDYEGAKLAGWRTCLVDRAGRTKDDGIVKFATLGEAVDYLLKERKPKP